MSELAADVSTYVAGYLLHETDVTKPQFHATAIAHMLLPLIDAAREEGRANALRPVAELLARWEAGADSWGTCSHEWISLDQLRAALAPDAPTAAPSGVLSDGEGSGGTPGHRDADRTGDGR